MRWTPKPPLEEGVLRNQTRFLFLRKTIGKESRWLEWATWCEQSIAFYSYGVRSIKWQAIAWRDTNADDKHFGRNLYNRFFSKTQT